MTGPGGGGGGGFRTRGEDSGGDGSSCVLIAIAYITVADITTTYICVEMLIFF